MEDLKRMDHAALLDLLTQKTKDYMRMFREGASRQEYEACKEMISKVTREIEERKTKNEQPSRRH